MAEVRAQFRFADGAVEEASWLSDGRPVPTTLRRSHHKVATNVVRFSLYDVVFTDNEGTIHIYREESS